MGRRGVTGTAGRRAGALALLLLLLLPLAALPAAAADESAALTISGTIGPISGLAADFSGAPRYGPAPLSVQFTDLSTGDPTAWSWDLDGRSGEESVVRDPAYVYHREGSYAVTLTVINGAGSDTETKPGYITVSKGGALARVRTLQKYVAAMPADGWVKWFLSIPLEVAEMQIRRGNERAAAAQMQVFSRQVEFYQRFRFISAQDATYLREEAAIVREMLRE